MRAVSARVARERLGDRDMRLGKLSSAQRLGTIGSERGERRERGFKVGDQREGRVALIGLERAPPARQVYGRRLDGGARAG